MEIHAFSGTVFTEYVWTVGQTREKIYSFSNQNGYLWTGPNFHSLAVNFWKALGCLFQVTVASGLA